MLTTGELYREAGGDYFTRRDPERCNPAASSSNSKRSDTTSPCRPPLKPRPIFVSGQAIADE